MVVCVAHGGAVGGEANIEVVVAKGTTEREGIIMAKKTGEC
jgi:hypothetical protein